MARPSGKTASFALRGRSPGAKDALRSFSEAGINRSAPPVGRDRSKRRKVETATRRARSERGAGSCPRGSNPGRFGRPRRFGRKGGTGLRRGPEPFARESGTGA
jgi:hypothetical protein